MAATIITVAVCSFQMGMLFRDTQLAASKDALRMMPRALLGSVATAGAPTLNGVCVCV